MLQVPFRFKKNIKKGIVLPSFFSYGHELKCFFFPLRKGNSNLNTKTNPQLTDLPRQSTYMSLDGNLNCRGRFFFLFLLFSFFLQIAITTASKSISVGFYFCS